ncbi:hypothetical protein [Salinicoccus sp. YB14-2]|uniref:hypothetical protein n=1 Tax=Salinicoccus sp. YB14-2 TaxID=1572701 RepID=UPI00068F017D|nr:hypothetical protein [Salinicoccus sp. YB14-2]
MVKMNIKDLIKSNEKVYKGMNHTIKHLFIPTEKSEHLIVIFSGFHGREITGKPPVYNYIKTLSEIPANKLFILDSVEDVPVYYYGTRGRDSYLQDTSNLIISYLKKLNIDQRRLILAGSSKGGTGALAIGFNIEAGHIISAANQLYVGDYLNSIPKVRNLIFNNIFGNNEDNNVERLNKSFEEKILVKKSKSNLYFHAGTRDYTYAKHMKPMLIHFDENKIYYELDLRNYVGHSAVVYYFPEYLKRKINDIINSPKINNLNVITDIDSTVFQLEVTNNRPKTYKYKIEICMKDGTVNSSEFQKSLYYQFNNIEPRFIDVINITQKQYDIIKDYQTFDITQVNYKSDDFNKRYLFEGEWINTKGIKCKNENMYRTSKLRYNNNNTYFMHGNGYIAYYKGNKFIFGKRYFENKINMPHKIESVQDVDSVVISFNKVWLENFTFENSIN